MIFFCRIFSIESIDIYYLEFKLKYSFISWKFQNILWKKSTFYNSFTYTSLIFEQNFYFENLLYYKLAPHQNDQKNN